MDEVAVRVPLKPDHYDRMFEDGMRYALLVVRKRRSLGVDKALSIGFFALDSYKRMDGKF